eukprot:gene3236-3513_t
MHAPQIRDNIVWTPNSPPLTDARFRNNSGPGAPPDLFKLWLFNITNLEEVRQGGRPLLEQVGPYVHRAYHEKHEVLWSGDGRVQFKDYTYYVFDRELTPAHVDPGANITTFNLALLGVLSMLHGKLSPAVLPWADLLMEMISSYQGDTNMHGVFVSKPALELLWGYEDQLLKALESWLPAGTLPDGPRVNLLKNTSSLADALAREPSVFNTGELNISNVWTEEVDQGRAEISSWPCPQPITGSDASQFRPGLTVDDKLRVFVGDIFQSRDLVVHSQTELHDVKLLRFWLDPAQDDPNSTWAHCHDQELLGLMNITTPHAAGLKGNASGRGPYVFVSMPMFCGADERLAADSGLVCDEERHQTFIDVEPITGITLRAFKRLMVSSRVGGLGSVLDPKVVGNLTIPMFWAEEAVEAPEAATKMFTTRVYRAQWVVLYLGKACWLASGLLLLSGLVLAVLTVQLAADPDRWPGGPADVMASARNMLASAGAPAGRSNVPPGELPVSTAAQHYGVVARPASAGQAAHEDAAVDQDEEQQRLLGQ